jgi:hypothetical protein
VKVEFLPEPGAVTAVAKQIKATHRAFPLFGTGRLFLERPERHRVRLTTLKPEAPLYQVADGPIALDRALVDRDAFRVLKSKYYREESQQGDPPKGNFSNVARLRGSGLLIGPTNYHSYQPALRRIYEERYSRRMSFAEFQSREIVIANDEQSIADWKEQARTSVTWTTTQEAEPRTFKSLAEVEGHFRQHYLAGEIKCEQTLEANGAAMRTSGDRGLIAAIRETIERERAFPAGIVNAMRPILAEAGLHFFKHRKRVVFVSTIRPLPHPVGQPAKESVAKILGVIEGTPRCTRHDLAVKLIGKDFETPEKAEEKTALAADLHYLLLAGHVIEFTDGKFDLPLHPKAASASASAPAVEAESSVPGATIAQTEPAPTETAEEEPKTRRANAPESAAPAEEVPPSSSEIPEPPTASTPASEPIVSDDETLETPAQAVAAEPPTASSEPWVEPETEVAPMPPQESAAPSSAEDHPASPKEILPQLVAPSGESIPPPAEMTESDKPAPRE